MSVLTCFKTVLVLKSRCHLANLLQRRMRLALTKVEVRSEAMKSGILSTILVIKVTKLTVNSSWKLKMLLRIAKTLVVLSWKVPPSEASSPAKSGHILLTYHMTLNHTSVHSTWAIAQINYQSYHHHNLWIISLFPNNRKIPSNKITSSPMKVKIRQYMLHKMKFSINCKSSTRSVTSSRRSRCSLK